MAIIPDKEKKYEFRDISVGEERRMDKNQGVLKLFKENNHVYVI